MPTVKFFLRSNNDLSKSFVLYCRVSHNGTMAEISLREKLDPKYWNQNEQRAKTPSKVQTQFINYTVESYTYKIKSMFLEKDFRNASARQILTEAFQGEQQEPRISVLIDQYIQAQKNAKYTTIINHRIKEQNFLKFEKYAQISFLPSTFGAVDANGFIQWFKRSKSTDKNNSAIRNALFIKSVLQWALNQGLIERFSISSYTARKDKIKDPVFIDREEFTRLYAYSCPNKYHDRIKDLFAFQCLTGLSYCDLWSWKMEQKNNQLFLIGNRNKNGYNFQVPLDPMALAIIHKYNGKLPIYENAVYNRVLKIVAQDLKINKRLTTHVGRKTFATLQDGKGWSKEAIALMLGHKSIRTTETYYIGSSFERLETELENMKKAVQK